MLEDIQLHEKGKNILIHFRSDLKVFLELEVQHSECF